MPQVSVRVNGREYDLTCGDGEEAHLRDLALYVDAKITALRGTGANLSDAQLLLMAGIVISDELSEVRESARNQTSGKKSAPDEMADLMDTAASRIEAMIAGLEAL
ncbi:MAG: cell division protein ZapA [Alphaproteobacteria bacterium]